MNERIDEQEIAGQILHALWCAFQKMTDKNLITEYKIRARDIEGKTEGEIEKFGPMAGMFSRESDGLQKAMLEYRFNSGIMLAEGGIEDDTYSKWDAAVDNFQNQLEQIKHKSFSSGTEQPKKFCTFGCPSPSKYAAASTVEDLINGVNSFLSSVGVGESQHVKLIGKPR